MSSPRSEGKPVSASRRREARAEGQVARSRDLVFALLYAVVLATLLASAEPLLRLAGGQLRHAMLHAGEAGVSVEDTIAQLRRDAVGLAWFALGWCLLLGVTVVLGHWVQHGPLWLPGNAVPDVTRVSPMAGWQRVVRRGSFIAVVIACLKVVILAGLAVLLLHDQQASIRMLSRQPVNVLTHESLRLMGRVGAWLGLGLVVSAAMDLAWQLWRHERHLMEIPDEPRQAIRAVRNDVSQLPRRQDTSGSP